MEHSTYGGDLNDIIRGNGSSSTLPSTWGFQSDPISDNPPTIHEEDHNTSNTFGDPFFNLRDPLLHELNIASSGYFNTASTTTSIEFGDSHNINNNNHLNNYLCGAISISSSSNSTRRSNINNLVFDYDQDILHKTTSTSTTNSCNIFSRNQISSEKTKLPFPAHDDSNSNLVEHAIGTSINGCLIENNTVPAQILSTRNIGIKRRKSQAKKVVCIPAPAAPNNRPSGEVVPSDLWAWRKYGQKPIKGSPYPRGYYRCSSSKGCCARKQVERSRNDPNMLVITYTSEHNHPWPTQRNALAGSTRSQLSQKKTSASSTSIDNNNKNSNVDNNTKDEEQDEEHEAIATTSNDDENLVNSVGPHDVKLEENNFTSDQEGLNTVHDGEHEKSTANSTYKPALNMSSTASQLLCDQDFFAELGEIEADPLELLGKGDLGPFSIFDWSHQDHTNNTNTSPF